MHGCIYCYTKGYSIYPGADVIEVYQDMAERITDEISRKRQKPQAVYFCPSCDPFQPIDEIQKTSFNVMRILLERGIGVQFVTKGEDPKGNVWNFSSSTMSWYVGRLVLLVWTKKFASSSNRILQPSKDKLEQLSRLIEIGVIMSARCDPMIHGLMDSHDQQEQLFSAIASTGCKQAALSYLFLRPAITKSLRDSNL